MAFNKEISEESSSFHSIAKQVPVKISEHYRPPRKVTVSSGVLQRKHAKDFTLLYDFSLEKSIIDKMAQMKVLRTQDKQKLKETSAAYNKAREKKEEKTKGDKSDEEPEDISGQVGNPKVDSLSSNIILVEEGNGNSDKHKETGRIPDDSSEAVNVSLNPSQEFSTVEVLPSAPPPFPMVASPPPNMFTPSHLAKDSPVLSPVPFGSQSSTCSSVNQTPVSSPVVVSSHVEPVSYSVSNHPNSQSTYPASANSTNYASTQLSMHSNQLPSTENYPTQSPLNTGNTNPINSHNLSNTSHSFYQNISVPTPMYSYNSNVPMLDSYTYPNVSRNYGNAQTGIYSQPFEGPLTSTISNFPTSSFSDYSSVCPTYSNPTSSCSNAPQSSHVSTISTLNSPVVHHGVSSEPSPVYMQQMYAPQYTGVLQPTSHLQTGAHNVAVMKEKQKVNVKDFEQDTSSPFDNCELKSINDMEELRYVLEQCVIKQEQLQQQLGQSMQYAPQYQYTGNPAHGSQSMYDHRIASNAPASPQPTFLSQAAPPSSNSLTQNAPTDFHNLASNVPYSSQNFPSNFPSTQNIPSNFQDIQSRSNNLSRFETNSDRFQNIPYQTSIAQHHLHNTSTQNQSNSNLPHVPLENRENSTGISQLPASQLSEQALSEQHNAFSNVVRVPSVLNELRNELRKKRESEEQNETGLVSPENEECPSEDPVCEPFTLSLPPPHMQASYLPNPYLSLTHAEQETVDRIVEMGFLQSRTARALQTQGPTQEKIIEFLIHVLALEEKYPELSATDVVEDSLLDHALDRSSTEKFLHDVIKLSRLGFSVVRVARALRNARNNQEKALDMLVS